jgi:endonuclease/exonuclease/phosphatase family metal-dependent hydrolase
LTLHPKLRAERPQPRAVPMTGGLRWIARGAVVLTGMPVALMALANLRAWPPWWWLELLHYLPFPFFLLPALVGLGASMLLSAVWRAAAMTSVLLVLTVVMGLVLGRADRGDGALRVLTYNVKAYRAEEQPDGFARLVQEVMRHEPDLVVMQDAMELTQRRRQAPDTAAALFAGRSSFSAGQYIVISRYPLRDCRTGDITHAQSFQQYVRCTFTADGVDLDVITTHLLSPRDGLNATRREQWQGLDEWRRNFDDRLGQATRLAADIAQRQRPLIVAGDLNAPEPAAVIRTLLRGGLRDAFSAAGLGYGYTHGHTLRPGFSFLRIDHVLVSPEIGVADSFAGGWRASEHRPVIADLLLRRTPD